MQIYAGSKHPIIIIHIISFAYLLAHQRKCFDKTQLIHHT